MLWDRGTWTPRSGRCGRGAEEGRPQVHAERLQAERIVGAGAHRRPLRRRARRRRSQLAADQAPRRLGRRSRHHRVRAAAASRAAATSRTSSPRTRPPSGSRIVRRKAATPARCWRTIIERAAAAQDVARSAKDTKGHRQEAKGEQGSRKPRRPGTKATARTSKSQKKRSSACSAVSAFKRHDCTPCPVRNDDRRRRRRAATDHARDHSHPHRRHLDVGGGVARPAVDCDRSARQPLGAADPRRRRRSASRPSCSKRASRRGRPTASRSPSRATTTGRGTST